MEIFYAFIDESQAGRYRLCVVAVQQSQLTEIRSSLESLRLPGQRRIHMSKESDRRKSQICQLISKLPGWDSIVIESGPKKRITPETRQELFLLAAQHPLWNKIQVVVVEDSNERMRDRRTLSWLNKYGDHKFDYRFEKPSQESCLWLADVIAWSMSKGGAWKKIFLDRVEVLSGP
jgi:hypothetical protein